MHGVSFEGNQYAVKIISILQCSRHRDYSHIYREYLLGVLSDQLGWGPALHPLFGYDIVITPDSAFFVMEKCNPVETTNAQLYDDMF